MRQAELPFLLVGEGRSGLPSPSSGLWCPAAWEPSSLEASREELIQWYPPNSNVKLFSPAEAAPMPVLSKVEGCSRRAAELPGFVVSAQPNGAGDRLA